MTLGSQGVVITHNDDEPVHVAANKVGLSNFIIISLIGLKEEQETLFSNQINQLNQVKAVDSVGAGDSFVGAFAHFHSNGLAPVESCRRACVVASMSVTKPGTQSSYPTLDELPEELKDIVV